MDTKYGNHTFHYAPELSKCEVKALIILPLLFYVKSNFAVFKQSKDVIFGNFRESEL